MGSKSRRNLNFFASASGQEGRLHWGVDIHYLSVERERGFLKRERATSCIGFWTGRGLNTNKKKKLAPENEIKRESYSCQVQHAAGASRCNINNEPLFLLQRARTSFGCPEIQQLPESVLEGWPMYGKRERETRFQ